MPTIRGICNDSHSKAPLREVQQSLGTGLLNTVMTTKSSLKKTRKDLALFIPSLRAPDRMTLRGAVVETPERPMSVAKVRNPTRMEPGIAAVSSAVIHP